MTHRSVGRLISTCSRHVNPVDYINTALFNVITQAPLARQTDVPSLGYVALKKGQIWLIFHFYENNLHPDRHHQRFREDISGWILILYLTPRLMEPGG